MRMMMIKEKNYKVFNLLSIYIYMLLYINNEIHFTMIILIRINYIYIMYISVYVYVSYNDYLNA